MQDIDYRSLLERYVRHILAAAGGTYISSMPDVSALEIRALREIELLCQDADETFGHEGDPPQYRGK